MVQSGLRLVAIAEELRGGNRRQMETDSLEEEDDEEEEEEVAFSFNEQTREFIIHHPLLSYSYSSCFYSPALFYICEKDKKSKQAFFLSLSIIQLTWPTRRRRPLF